MRHLLPFALAAIGVLSFAGCAGPLITNPPKGHALAEAGGRGCARFAEPEDTKIQIYCSTRRHAQVQPVSDVPSNCRMLLDKSGDGVESSCRDAAQWNEYDTVAVNAGVTCRWRSMTQEVCLTAGNWKKQDDAARRALRVRSASGVPRGGFGSPWGGSGAGSGSQAAWRNIVRRVPRRRRHRPVTPDRVPRPGRVALVRFGITALLRTLAVCSAGNGSIEKISAGSRRSERGCARIVRLGAVP